MSAKSATLTASIKAMMSDLIDYAGLFPPAKLALPEAFANYARYRQESDRWMLGRFIIPAAQLPELAAIAGNRFQSGDPFVFSALSTSNNAFLSGLAKDLKTIRAFRKKHGDKVVVDVIEVRLPASGDLQAALSAATEQITAMGGLTAFYEVPAGLDWRRRAVATISVIAHLNRQGTAVGFKLRCGGVEAAAFPEPPEMAVALAACRDYRVPMKATAGLHHPIRRYDASVNTKMYGFLNVFGAGLLAHVHRLNEAQIEAILVDEDPAHFVFGTDGFAWRDLDLNTAMIGELRHKALLSYGSCSFDEPRADLRALGWL